jgi:hypothetical protein
MYQQRYQNQPETALLAAFRDLLLSESQGEIE